MEDMSHNKNLRPTPETDAQLIWVLDHRHTEADFASYLERQRDELMEALRDLCYKKKWYEWNSSRSLAESFEKARAILAKIEGERK